MATRIHVIQSGAPVQNALVWVGETVGEKLKTNSDGKVSFDLTPGWQGYYTVLVELSDGTPITSSLVIKEGNDHTIDISSLTIPT